MGLLLGVIAVCVGVWQAIIVLVLGLLGLIIGRIIDCLLYTSPSPRDRTRSRMPSSA